MPFLMLALFVVLVVFIFFPTFVLWSFALVGVAALGWLVWQLRGEKIP